MGVIELGVADMIMAIITLAICVVLLTIKMFNNETRLNRVEESCDVLENVAEGLSDRCDTHKKSIEYLSKSVRELNGVVEAAVKVKEETSDNKPDVEALIGGWDADETEPEDPVKKHIVDICLNGTAEQKQDLIDASTLQNILLSQTQQCNYQTLRGDLLSQTQQCIYPWQQTPSGAILPLWYINRRLGDE